MDRPTPGFAADEVVAHIWQRIETGELRPGSRLPAERELADQIGVSRPSVRAGLRELAAIGVVSSRRGSGTFISDGPPSLDSRPLHLLTKLHGITADETFEARRHLEVGVAGLAAGRAGGDQLAAIAEEVMSLYETTDRPQEFLLHDLRFHRAVAEAAGNPVLAALVDMVAGLFYEQRLQTIERSRDLKDSADQHRRIFQAIRSGDPAAAREAMNEHLEWAQVAQQAERDLAGESCGGRSDARSEESLR